jgi:hypothetical protein
MTDKEPNCVYRANKRFLKVLLVLMFQRFFLILACKYTPRRYIEPVVFQNKVKEYYKKYGLLARGVYWRVRLHGTIVRLYAIFWVWIIEFILK